MGNSQISGIWTHSVRKLHINSWELKAVILALHHWVTALQGLQVMFTTDNTTAVLYIHKQGGTHSHTLLCLVVALFYGFNLTCHGQSAKMTEGASPTPK